MATRLKPFNFIRLAVTFVCVTLLTVLLAAVGTDWSARQAQRYFAEMEETYGSGIRPGTVITYGQLYEGRAERAGRLAGPLSAFEEQDWRDIPALYIPQEDELFCQFYTVAAVLVFSLALAAGLLGALWRRLGLGRGASGAGCRWNGMCSSAFCMLACCVDGAGHIVWAARDGTFANVAHTLFFLDADDSMLLGKSRGGGVAVAGCVFRVRGGRGAGRGPAGRLLALFALPVPLVRVPAAFGVPAARPCAALPLWICAAR